MVAFLPRKSLAFITFTKVVSPHGFPVEEQKAEVELISGTTWVQRGTSSQPFNWVLKQQS